MNSVTSITMRPPQAASYLGLSEQRLAHLRLSGGGPRYAKLGRSVTYLREDLDSWLRSKLRTSTGRALKRVMAGIDAARAAGLQVKINTVALKGDNAHELPAMIQWAHAQGMGFTLIETMPMGEVEADRTDQFLSLAEVRRELESFWTLTDLAERTPGPARYVRVEETGGRLGFITPLSHNFCEACNRVRLTCTGTLHTCLGQEDSADLRAVIRTGASDADLIDAIRLAVDAKPKGHDFQIARAAAPAVARHMSTTGG